MEGGPHPAGGADESRRARAARADVDLSRTPPARARSPGRTGRRRSKSPYAGLTLRSMSKPSDSSTAAVVSPKPYRPALYDARRDPELLDDGFVQTSDLVPLELRIRGCRRSSYSALTSLDVRRVDPRMQMRADVAVALTRERREPRRRTRAWTPPDSRSRRSASADRAPARPEAGRLHRSPTRRRCPGRTAPTSRTLPPYRRPRASCGARFEGLSDRRKQRAATPCVYVVPR